MWMWIQFISYIYFPDTWFDVLALISKQLNEVNKIPTAVDVDSLAYETVHSCAYIQ